MRRLLMIFCRVRAAIDTDLASLPTSNQFNMVSANTESYERNSRPQ